MVDNSFSQNENPQFPENEALLPTDSYNEQPTLLVGLGGFGAQVVDHVYRQVKDQANVIAFAIDTDVSAVDTLRSIPRDHFLCIAHPFPVSEGIHRIPRAKEWLSNHPILLHHVFCEGAGQIRGVARLLYELSLQEDRFRPLLVAAERMAAKCTEKSFRMRISVTSSLVGGTGSGIFMQVALLLRDRISALFPELDVKIHGEFILPSNFLYIYSNPRVEKRNMEANAYAALKELDAVNKGFFGGGSPVELSYKSSEPAFVDTLPYDYCYLYDRINLENSFNGKYIEDAIIERLFSPSANHLNEAFETNQPIIKKLGSNLYGSISVEKLPASATILNSDLFRSIINRTSAQPGKQIFFLASPRNLYVDHAQFPINTVVLEHVDPTLSEITVIDYSFAIELNQIEKLRHGTGQYFSSYHNLVNRQPAIISPHLNKNWHLEMKNIGEEIPEAPVAVPTAEGEKAKRGKFVFISYSSRDFETAKQLKRVLETNGISCWMAPQSIPAGSDYANEIPKAIGEAGAFLLLLSDSSQKSQWVPKEISIAISKEVVVVPFQIDNADINEAFNFYLTNSQRISAYNRVTDAYQELLLRLKNLLNEA